MPSRIIKESITTSESLSEVSAEAERLFWRLVVKADDFGLYYGNPRILASMCFPLDPPKEQRIRAWLDELVAAGMVGTYTSDEDGKKYLKLLSWDRHQQQRAKKSKFPLPVAYCSCEKCCGTWAENRPDGIVYTASGAVAQEGVTIAADWDVLPPGTVVYIDGLGERVVQDRGGAIKGNAVDVYFEDHDEALVFGRQTVRLYIVEGGDGP